MEILFFDELLSTQSYLESAVREGDIVEPVAVVAKRQSGGVGSRSNSWYSEEGDLTASVAFRMDMMPQDLPLGSVSIYFAYIMKESIAKFDENIWLKWPNDLYIENKIGGIVSRKIKNFIIVGIGINMKKNRKFFDSLDIGVSPMILLDMFLKELETPPKWKDIFSKYRIEFENKKACFAHIEGRRTSLKNSILCEDGSLIINNRRVFSLR